MDKDKKVVKKKGDKENKAIVKNTIELNPKLDDGKEMNEVFGRKSETGVFTFGRMNPPTIGHEKLVKAVEDVARKQKATPHVFLSHSQDAKTNPLPYDVKFKIVKRAFGRSVEKSKSRTVIEVLKELEKMHKKIIMVVGSDRVAEFEKLLNTYNGRDFNFESIEVVSAGERDPDSDGVSGMSGTKMRELAAAGNEKEFKKGLPRKITGLADWLIDNIRDGMKIKGNPDEDINEEVQDIEEVLTLAQRRKKAMTLRRLKARIIRGRKIAQRKMATKEKLQKRSRRQAIKFIRKRIAGKKGANYANLSPGEKAQIDRLVAKRKSAIGKIATRLMPKVRQAERERLKAFHASKKEDFDYIEALNIIAEAYWRVDIEGLPAVFVDGPSASTIKNNLRKLVKKPNEQIKSIDRVQRADIIKAFRLQAQGKESEDTGTIGVDEKFHMLLDKNGKPKQDKRFRFNKKEITEEELFRHIDAMFEEYEEIEQFEKIEQNIIEKAEKANVSVDELFEKFVSEDSVKDGYHAINSFIAFNEGKKGGLWDNIHKKRERIKRGSGERMRKPGEKGAPTAADFKAASEEVEQVDEISRATKASYLKKAGKDHYDMFTGRKPGTKQKLDKRRASIQKVSKALTGKKKFSDYDPKTKQYTNEDVNSVFEAYFEVGIEGLPKIYMDAKSSGEVKQQLRRLLKKPNEQIQSIDRVQKSDMRKSFRDRAAGKEVENDEEDNLDEAFLYDVSWGTVSTQVSAKDASDAISKAKAKIIQKTPKLRNPKYRDTFLKRPSVYKITGKEPRAEGTENLGAAQEKIKREKEADKKKHDRMLDRARTLDTRVANNEMSEPQLKKREEIVKAMKDAREADLKRRYGDRWKEVMYATATKQAMQKEEVHDKCGTPDCCGQCDTSVDAAFEAFTLQLDRGKNQDALKITETGKKGWTEVRGKTNYEGKGYDSKDKLHKTLDKIGKAANMSELMNGSKVSVNPKHPDARKAIAELERLVREEHGAGDEGTNKLVKKYKKDTPGETVKEAISYMEERNLDFCENIYRPMSEAYFEFFREARRMYESGEINVEGVNKQLLETDIGEFVTYEGNIVPLDCPLIEEEEKNPELGKPKRGGTKKFYVYVKDPSTGNIKKVSWGDTTGLKTKINNPEARKSFAARHKCDTRNDKTTASYWACRLPRYAKALGMQVDNPGSWW